MSHETIYKTLFIQTRGAFLDTALQGLARDLIELEKTTGFAPNVEKNKQLKSMSARGLAKYKAEPYVEQAKELMSGSSFNSAPETE